MPFPLRQLRRFGTALVLASGLSAQGAPPAAPIAAKLLAMLAANSSDPGRVACDDAEVAQELRRLGLRVEPTAKVAWACRAEDLGTYRNLGRMAVCGYTGWLDQGAAVAVVSEGGRTRVYVNPAEVRSSGETVPSFLLRFAVIASARPASYREGS